MTKTHAELLPCPFCSKKPILSCTDFDHYVVECCNVHVYGDSYSHDLAIQNWNTRINKEAKFLEKLKNELKFLSDKYSIVSFDGTLLSWLKGAVVKIEQFEAEQRDEQCTK